MQNAIQLRQTSAQEAQLYDKDQPDYPEALFADLAAFSGIAADGRVLAIGSGSGKAMLPLARRGYHILGVEVGASLTAAARCHLSEYPRVSIQSAAFEDWPGEAAAFDLAFSAPSFHWLDPAISYQKTARVLKPAGTLAIFQHVHVQSEASQGFFETIQPIYQREDPRFRPMVWPHKVAEPGKAEIERSGLFSEVTVRRYRWNVSYDPASYLCLLNTYSGHRVLDCQSRHRLFHEIADVIEARYHGHITKEYLATLSMAHRK